MNHTVAADLFNGISCHETMTSNKQVLVVVVGESKHNNLMIVLQRRICCSILTPSTASVCGLANIVRRLTSSLTPCYHVVCRRNDLHLAREYCAWLISKSSSTDTTWILIPDSVVKVSSHLHAVIAFVRVNVPLAHLVTGTLPIIFPGDIAPNSQF